MLFAVWEQFTHHLVIAGQCYQFVHSTLDVVAAHQLVQLLARVGDRAKNLHLYADGAILLYFAVR